MFYQGEHVYDRKAGKARVVVKIEWIGPNGPLAEPLYLLGDSASRDWREAPDVGQAWEARRVPRYALALVA